MVDEEVIGDSFAGAEHDDPGRWHRPSVEDAPDEDYPPSSAHAHRFHQYFPEHANAGHASQTAETRFEQWEREDREAKREPWSPYTSRSEWDLTRFMVKHMGQNEIEEFLGLDMVRRL